MAMIETKLCQCGCGASWMHKNVIEHIETEYDKTFGIGGDPRMLLTLDDMKRLIPEPVEKIQPALVHCGT